MKTTPETNTEAAAPIEGWIRAKFERMIATNQCRRSPPPTIEEIAPVIAHLFKDPTPIFDPVGGGQWSLNAWNDLIYLPRPQGGR